MRIRLTRAEVVQKASDYLQKTTGKCPEPYSVTLHTYRDTPPHWSVAYRLESFYPEEAAEGVIMDGPYALRVDDATGEISVV